MSVSQVAPPAATAPLLALSRRERRARWFGGRHRAMILAPVLGGFATFELREHPHRLGDAIVTLAALMGGMVLARRVAPHAALLPLMRVTYPLVGPLVATASLAVLGLLTGEPIEEALDLAVVCAVATVVSGRLRPTAATGGGVLQVVYVGAPPGAVRIARLLELAGSGRYALIGRISGPGEGTADVTAPVPDLGSLEQLDVLVVEHAVDVIVLGGQAPRRAVYAKVAQSCLELPVRVVELAALYEEVLGHVPVGEIYAEWFECIADPARRRCMTPVKRAIDLGGATVMGLLALPLVAALAALIRRDGGSVLFKQVRIGEGGTPFVLYKLRTMRPDSVPAAQWARMDDPRITRIGRLLRRTHLDELPQLVNVMRGEMTLVGPRPEQPQFVDRLEQAIPFYQRRHLMRPGITGWAQIRCGYAGSDLGSAWKLSHDLYYIKHRSIGLDLLVLCETFATLLLRREPVMLPESVDFVVAPHR
jgi:lipopolysaccharide/colanic/teichoic acid biosynthesis glycosyltransferase